MVARIHNILHELRSVSYDERDKGYRFERFMRTNLTVEPQYERIARIVTVSVDAVKVLKALPLLVVLDA